MSFLSELRKQKNKLKETETVVTRVDGKRYVEGNEKIVEPNLYGFVVDTQPDDIPVLITDYIYIGSQDCAVDKVLKEYNIKHVLSLGVDMCVDVNHKFVLLLDLPETDVKPFLSECLGFIREAVEMKENVLVHCNAGVSRTSMVAIAYLMHFDHMQFSDAYSLVKAKRPAVQPNAGFRKQLQDMKPDPPEKLGATWLPPRTNKEEDVVYGSFSMQCQERSARRLSHSLFLLIYITLSFCLILSVGTILISWHNRLHFLLSCKFHGCHI